MIARGSAPAGTPSASASCASPLLNRALAPVGLTVQEWEESAYVLRSPSRRDGAGDDLTALLVEAERLAKRPLDPLDPVYLEGLR